MDNAQKYSAGKNLENKTIAHAICLKTKIIQYCIALTLQAFEYFHFSGRRTSMTAKFYIFAIWITHMYHSSWNFFFNMTYKINEGRILWWIYWPTFSRYQLTIARSQNESDCKPRWKKQTGLLVWNTFGSRCFHGFSTSPKYSSRDLGARFTSTIWTSWRQQILFLPWNYIYLLIPNL